MKTKTILIALVSLLAVTAVVFQSCKKDKPKDPTPPVYTNGQGEIGEIGGTVKIDDPSSPINGASIVVPEGALKKTVTFKIEQPDSNYYVNGKQNHIIIDIQPSGIQFEKPVTIGIPYNSIENEQYFKPFYYNPEKGELEELNPVKLDKQNKIYYAETMHTSFYLDDEMEMMIYWVKIDDNDTTRIAAYTNIITDFDNLPTGWAYALEGYPDAYSILYSHYVPGVASNFVARLYKKGLITSDLVSTKEMEVWINACSANDQVGRAVVDKVVNGNHTTLISKDYVSKRDIADDWMSGYPLLFIFDDFTPNTSDKYFVRVSWGQEKDYRTFTNRYNLGKKSDAIKLSEMGSTTGDANLNGILDNYEGGSGGNQPPTPPTLVSPSDGATNVNTNVTLKWNCTDPDGDYITYSVLLDEDYPPSEYEVTNISNNQLSVNDLEPNTTYYWSIDAMDDEHTTEGNTWSFTTGNGGGGGTPPTGYFTDPRDGQEYAYIEIGSQTWMAENLNYASQFSICYDNNVDNCDIYGKLYAHYDENKNVCPDGWHIPNDNDWKQLEMALGMSQIEADSEGWRGNDEGKKMKSLNSWNENGNGTNSSGFNALPGGEYDDFGQTFYDLGNKGHWLTYSSDMHKGNERILRGNYESEYRSRDNVYHNGYISIRCIKNTSDYLKADFTTESTNGNEPFTIDFIDQSDNNPTSWNWDFGDGCISTQQNPSHTYYKGTYTVKLTVENNEGYDAETKTSYITVSSGYNGSGTFVDPRDNQVYNYIQIGNQVWMSENLNYMWNTSWCYDNQSDNCEIYGKLYRWGESATTACPPNWHLPSDDDWKQLEMALGMSQIEADSEGWRGNDEGKKMKSINGWNENGNGTNTSGFNAIPGGFLFPPGDFMGIGDYSLWWTSTSFNNNSIWVRELGYNKNSIHRYSVDQSYFTTHAFSVRCLMD